MAQFFTLCVDFYTKGFFVRLQCRNALLEDVSLFYKPTPLRVGLSECVIYLPNPNPKP